MKKITHIISIKTIPENYIHYRYQNINSLEGINLETQILMIHFLIEQ